MKIYTKTGDDGTTGLYGGGRVRKDDPRMEACGSVDELNAAIGLVRAARAPAEIERLLATVQNRLFDLGAELGTGASRTTKPTPAIEDSDVAELEAAIDRFDASLPTLKTFILPAGSHAAVALHLARTVCRRAERRVVALMAQSSGEVRPAIAVYLNRLSDLLFVLARAANAAAGEADVEWSKRT
jgi:cob(I)alamin adenosyltransferase